MLKKAIIFICCVTLLFCACLPSFNSSAAVINEGIITVATVSGNTGDTVIVPITIAENPGICGITVSITYDSAALEFIEDMMGDVIYEYQTKAHPTKNIIRLVTSEQGNKYNNGTMLSLKFKIADKTTAGLHEIGIKYRQGDFCNWKLDKIMPKIISGGVDVALSESNCPHKSYSKWSEATIATCTENGAEKRSCNACGHIELRDTEPIGGHEYSKEYTVDKEATKTENGLMSRHCIRCKDFTDQISYSLKDSDDGGIKNEFDTKVPVNDYINNLHKEQYPEKPESSVTQSTNSSSSSNPKDTASSENNESEIDKPTISKPQSNEQPLIEPDENSKLTVIEKIKEVFPEIDSFIKILKSAIIVLLSLMLI